MSNAYRDDTQETAVIIDSTWVGVKTLVTEMAKASAIALFGLAVVVTDTATASDDVFGSTHINVSDVAIISDEAYSQVYAHSLTTDIAKINDSQSFKLTSMATDTAVISDDTFGSLMAMANDTAIITDEAITKKTVAVNIFETSKISDLSLQIAHELATDEIIFFDSTSSKVITKPFAIDNLVITDEAVLNPKLLTPAVDIIKIGDGIFGNVTTFASVADWAVIEDEPVYTSDYPSDIYKNNQAWTANTKNWALSRYTDYSYVCLAVVNDVLYGCNDKGVFRLNSQSDEVVAKVATGKIDVSGGTLSYPTGCYMEYELTGKGKQAIMAVTSTQKGVAQTYQYKLPSEKADYLTNGRFIFGRGLRGRHFSFDLTVTGTHGYINDVSVEVATGKRRV